MSRAAAGAGASDGNGAGAERGAAAAPELSVVVVNWNAGGAVVDCLQSLRQAAGSLSLEVFVVDNASTDGSRERIAAGFPEFRLIANQRNAGFARANNQAFPLCGGRHILLLNPDTVVTADALRGLMEFLDHTADAGAAGLQLYFPDGRLQNSYDSFPSMASELFSKHLLRFLFPGKYPSKRVIPPGPVPVDLVIGACLLVRAPLLRELGGFDEQYFLFVEETDLCKRIWNAGWKIYHVPHLKICHSYHPSKSQAPAHAHIESWRSGYYYFRKHRPPAISRLFRLLKTLKLLCISTPLILAAQLLTLGKVARYRRRWGIRRLLSAWHLLGCPSSWGMRQVSGFRDFERLPDAFAGSRGELILHRRAGPLLRRALENLEEAIGGGMAGVEAIKKGRRKESYRILLPEPAPPELLPEGPSAGAPGSVLLLTIYRTRGLWRRISGPVRVPAGLDEFERACRVGESGIQTVLPVAAGYLGRAGFERISFIAFVEDAGLARLQDLLSVDGGAARDARHRAWLEAYGSYVRRLHDAGVDQRDLNPGNARVRRRARPEDAGSILLVDLERVELESPLDAGKRLRSLARLNRFRAGLTRADRLRFLKAYLEQPDPGTGRGELKKLAAAIGESMPALRQAEGDRAARTCSTANHLFGTLRAEEAASAPRSPGGPPGADAGGARPIRIDGFFRRRAFPWEDRTLLDGESAALLARRLVRGEPAPEGCAAESAASLQSWREANRAFQGGRTDRLPLLYMRAGSREMILFREPPAPAQE